MSAAAPAAALPSQTRATDQKIPLWRLAWQMFKRDLRQGEPRIMMLALILTTSAVAAVAFFNQRVESALAQQGASLIAGDLIVSHSQPPPPDMLELADAQGLRHSRYARFPTMAISDDDEMRLVSLKAVEAGYPLRGDLLVGQSIEQQQVAQGTPQTGEVWIAPTLLNELNVSVGDLLYIGDLELTIAELIQFEPDRTGGFSSLAPRVMIAWDDLESSGLLGPGSRVRYRMTVAGEPADISRFDALASGQFEADGWEVETAAEARPSLREALDRLGRFLAMSSLVAVMVAGAAIAMAANGFVRRQSDAVAIFRCFGAASSTIWSVVWRRLALLTLSACGVGVTLGFLIQNAAGGALAQAFQLTLPAPSLQPVLVAVLATGIAVLGFCLPAFLRLREVPVVRVLRRQQIASTRDSRRIFLGALAAMAVLLLWQSGDWRLGVIMLLALTAAPLLLACLGALCIALINRRRDPLRPGWPFGLTLFARRRGLSLLQVAALGVGAMAIYLLSVVSMELLNAWQQEIPDDAPNFFLVNVQQHQVDQATTQLESIVQGDLALDPIVRGRWTHLNGEQLEVSEDDSEDRRDALQRELNLTFATDQREDYQLTQGRWWTPEQAQSVHLLSMEAELAEDFGISLGDELTFRVAGQEVSGTVANFRAVEWESFNTNYYLVGTPALFDQMPHTFISAVRVNTDDRKAFFSVLRDLTGVSALDVDDIIKRVRALVDQSVRVINLVFSFSVLASLLVMIAAIYGTREMRGREIALLRVVGHGSPSITRTVLAEFALIGGVACAIAAIVAAIAGWALAKWLFEFSYTPNVMAMLALIASGALLTMAVGWLSVRRLLKAPPQRVLLRDA